MLSSQFALRQQNRPLCVILLASLFALIMWFVLKVGGSLEKNFKDFLTDTLKDFSFPIYVQT